MTEITRQLISIHRSNAQGKQPLESTTTEAISWNELLRELCHYAEDPHLHAHLPLQATWQEIIAALAIISKPFESSDQAGPLISRLYLALGTKVTQRHQLLTLLAKSGEPNALRHLASLLAEEPPLGIQAASAPLRPLFRFPAHQPISEHLFPKLLDALANPDLAPGILDLANHFFRQSPTQTHLAAPRVDQLLRLANGVTAHLERFQSKPAASPEQLAANQQRVASSLPLAISLAATLGVLGDQRAVPALEQLMDLRHRGLQAEAAAALIRLQHKSGRQRLAELAAEPSVRLRVLAYAEELGCSDQIEPGFQTPIAVAEARLVTFLSQPTVMGVPPSSCELVDHRTLAWPGYEEPRDCYLFRFTYHLVDDAHQTTPMTNIGISGPLEFIFRADLAELPMSDVYAAFAGWQGAHAEIVEFDWHNAEPRPATRQLAARLAGEFADFHPMVLGRFLGDEIVVAEARRDSIRGTVVADGNRIDWYPATGRPRPLSISEAYCIYKGRRLLESFNPTEDFA